MNPGRTRIQSRERAAGSRMGRVSKFAPMCYMVTTIKTCTPYTSITSACISFGRGNHSPAPCLYILCER
ncbi:hypothetical protein GDO81_028248 [Engystomops pustulosus]|uniref:Uncharacterized protein n=1 Tax=Engystomops pustulosus TaxID=76066 RepID=A0AAV6YDF7_ENGPU|nr:hypothetical protein GDO81_028248 [Engystomops pustulosus]